MARSLRVLLRRTGNNSNIERKNTLLQHSATVGTCWSSICRGLPFNCCFCRHGFYHSVCEGIHMIRIELVCSVLALAFSRELSPVVTAVVAGRIGSAFAAELGTMQVLEPTDALRILGANPVDYLVTPRVIASCIALPILTLLCFCIGLASSALLADGVYGVSINIILDSAHKALWPWDIISGMIKSQVFAGLIAVVSCAWGVSTMG